MMNENFHDQVNETSQELEVENVANVTDDTVNQASNEFPEKTVEGKILPDFDVVAASNNSETETDLSEPEDRNASEKQVEESTEKESPKPEETVDSQGMCTQINDNVKKLAESFAASEKRFAGIEDSISKLSNQISFIPPQVRTISKKVDDLNSSISGTKYQNLLKDLLMIFDLVEQTLQSPDCNKEEDSNDIHLRNYRVLRTQLLQILEMNGLSRISTEGRFDPKIHKALKSVPVQDENQDSMIVSEIRIGFQAGSSILRYAEVAVGKFAPPPENTEETVLDESDGANSEPKLDTSEESDTRIDQASEE